MMLRRLVGYGALLGCEHVAVRRGDGLMTPITLPIINAIILTAGLYARLSLCGCVRLRRWRGARSDKPLAAMVRRIESRSPAAAVSTAAVFWEGGGGGGVLECSELILCGLPCRAAVRNPESHTLEDKKK